MTKTETGTMKALGYEAGDTVTVLIALGRPAAPLTGTLVSGNGTWKLDTGADVFTIGGKATRFQVVRGARS